jgi:hypothetical protein
MQFKSPFMIVLLELSEVCSSQITVTVDINSIASSLKWLINERVYEARSVFFRKSIDVREPYRYLTPCFFL